MCFKHTCNTMYTTVPFCTGREIRTLKIQILSLTRLPISPFLLIVEVVGFEPTQSKDNGVTDRLSSPTLTYFQLSGKQDSNLQPPASKAGKQPIVIFPVI